MLRFNFKVAKSFLSMLMLINVLFDHIIGDIPCCSDKIANGPQMSTPVTFAQFRKCLLNLTRCLAFQVLHHLANTLIRWHRYIEVNMIARYPTSDNFHAVCLTDFTAQFPHTLGNIANQHRIAILSHPNNVIRTIKYCMTRLPIILHIISISLERTRWKRGVFLPNLGQ